MTSRNSPEDKAWKKLVRQRDGRYCQWPDCKRLGKQVHHIIPFASNLVLRTAVSNGILLCVTCHGKVKNKENNYAPMFMTIVERNTLRQKNKQQKRKP